MKVSLPLTEDRWIFLTRWFESMSRQAPIAEFPLASILLAESYERYLKKFTWKPKTLKMSVAEAMALHDSLHFYQTIKPNPHILITTLIMELFNLINNALDPHPVSHLTPAPSPFKEGGESP